MSMFMLSVRIQYKVLVHYDCVIKHDNKKFVTFKPVSTTKNFFVYFIKGNVLVLLSNRCVF